MMFTDHRRQTARPEKSPEYSQAGFILIASLAMLVVLTGTVLICLYPAAYEARQAPRHREALRRFKTAERGIFGRLADQPGGVHSAGGGFISDLGPKMIVETLVDNKPAAYEVTRLSRIMEFWFFRRFSENSVLNEASSDGNTEGHDDIFRYDPDTGFWRGFRGKRYIRRPVGQEHIREKVTQGTHGTKEFHTPRFYTGGRELFLELAGGSAKDTFFLKMTGDDDDLANYDSSGSQSDEHIEHTRYYNPVERLVVRVNDRRKSGNTTLSAKLIYARQPDPENATDIEDYFPENPSKVVTEEPFRSTTNGNTTRFFFYWDPANTVENEYKPRVDISHTFEIGLKKLVLLENDTAVFACGITIPPVRECQCEENDPRKSHHTGCSQPFSDQYVVEIDYDG